MHRILMALIMTTVAITPVQADPPEMETMDLETPSKTTAPDGPGHSAATVREGVFIHLSHGPEDPHRVLMALRMAEIMAADRDVLVYVDVTGIGAVLADSPDLELAPFTSSHAQLEKLVEMGVPVYACPGCLEAAGKNEADLMPGIRLADKDAFFDFTDGRILTLDY